MPVSPRDLFAAFRTAIDLRLRREQELTALTRQDDPHLAGLQAQRATAEERHTESLAAIEARLAAARQAAEARAESAADEAKQDYDQQVRQIARELDAESAALEQLHNSSAWVVSSVLDEDADDSPVRQHERFVSSVARTREEQVSALEAAQSRFGDTAAERGWRPRHPSVEPPSTDGQEATHEAFSAAMRETDDRLNELRRLWLPRLFIGWRSVFLFFGLGLAIAASVFFAVDPAVVHVTGGRFESPWIGTALVAGGVASLLITLLLYTLASMAQSEVFQRWEASLVSARVLQARWETQTADELSRRDPQIRKLQSEIEAQREGTLNRYRSTYETRAAEIRQRRESRLAEALADYRRAADAADRERQAALADADARHNRDRITEDDQSHSERDTLKTLIAERMMARQREQSAVWSTLKTGWERSSSEFFGEVERSQQESRQNFLDWSGLAAADIVRPTAIPDGVRIGDYGVHLDLWPGAVSTDMRLAPRKSEFRLPAVLPFPERPSLLLKSRTSEGRAAALPILQSAMLRLLTLLPPGTVRFTILDPVGLGDSFAGFMHLADFDEMLVTSRIWTEPSQIEARLADLTEHMENVLQTYLRNEFPTLEDYNRHAGEVAEPYRILVIRDFPAKFSEIAARRLISIITSGPRCGVYTLLSVDGKLQLPNNFHLADIEPAMNVFEWRSPQSAESNRWDWVEAPGASASATPVGGETVRFGVEETTRPAPPAFYSTEPMLAAFPLTADVPPDAETFSRIVKSAGAASKGARRVEVSFERIAPAPKDRWSRDSRSGIDVPMGRAGAIKLQAVRLGQGTSQHMLIAGKTGSGKSTFLHGLITNLALYYSPDELQFFLIDFKKGVEFKDYATFQLPHARVIAIESDREFGVSALTRLDELMQERGELFRRHGAQDVAGFRNANPGTPLPRILLVIDEFQEFFVEDDKYGQTAALLLDRLVRQGRAFGIHVVLGSQTLGGAYSLARSTLGQVAVRVALQCSEADAHLILSEENTAARLLSRPGEAIYNDANGLVEGNHPFQIAWLPDDKREQYLRDLQDLTQRRGLRPAPAIVFEGNIPSDLARNADLRSLIDGEPVPDRRRTAPRIWLGDAVEIGDPTAVALERHTSTNVLVVGQEPAAVPGVFAAAAVSLALQSGIGVVESPEPVVWLFDGSSSDDPTRDVWSRLEESLGSRLRIVKPQEAATALAALHAERLRRDANRQELAPTHCLLVYNLSRFRDLRKSEDDFGFGGYGADKDQPPSSSKQFAEFLSSGPDLGLHTLVWADSYNNVERWLGRQALREFELRVLFPLNAADSSNLIDSPLASRLGPGRAILYRDDRGSVEKFRPYAPPSPEFLETVTAALQGESPVEVATDLGGFRVS